MWLIWFLQNIIFCSIIRDQGQNLVATTVGILINQLQIDVSQVQPRSQGLLSLFENADGETKRQE